MQKITIQGFKKFFDDIKKELSLITWPTKKDMILSIVIVGITVIVAGSAFFAADYLLYSGVQLLIKL